MKIRLLLLVAGLFGLISPVAAHRLNEYLQAVTVNLSKEYIYFQLRLTPGTDIARQILSDIDLNRNGLISKNEQLAYVLKVKNDLIVSVDDNPVLMQLISSSFSTTGEITTGTGSILLKFKARLPAHGFVHQLKFENHHKAAMAVYLVNCLLPADTSIQIINQGRNYNQSNYNLNFKVNAVSPAAKTSRGQEDYPVVETYFFHGIRHILTGFDHLLFIGALVLAASSLWDLVKIITAFTIAHSITLTLAVLHVLLLPEFIVEPMIAASIVFVAVQNIFWTRYAGGSIRLAAAFFFGLFHGLGFAGGLLEVMHGMAPSLILWSIVGFSLGVEAGNQIVLLPMYGFLKLLKKLDSRNIKQPVLYLSFQRIGSLGIALAGMYYFCIALFTY